MAYSDAIQCCLTFWDDEVSVATMRVWTDDFPVL